MEPAASENIRVAAIVPAAGAGRRFGEGEPKQFHLLHGETILGRTVRAVAEAPSVDYVIVAAASGEIERVVEIVKGSCRKGVVVEGGEERFHSVWNALDAVPKGVEIVVVHDGVRPFVTVREIEETIAAARARGGAIAASAPVETVKEVDRTRIVRTVDRKTVRLAQTPQAFRVDLLRRAYAKAFDDRFVGTDESSLVERLGAVVVVVDADPANRKITTPADLAAVSNDASAGRRGK